MGKRRRERDKPKYAPDGAYDPNKRVLLSYGTDDEDDEVATREVKKAAELAVNDSRLANYQMTEYPEDEGEGEVTVGAVTELAPSSGLKGKENTKPEPEQRIGQEGAEWEPILDKEVPRAVTFRQSRTSGKARETGDPETGQRLALGAAARDHDDHEEEYDSTTEEALAYLNSVREERQAIPEVLAATRQVLDDHMEDGEERDADNDCLIEEDTYIARPALPVPEADITDPQYVFTRVLRERFLMQRQCLQINNDAADLAELGDGYPTSYQEGNRKQYAKWHHVLGSRSPMPAQVRSISQDTAFRLLALLQEAYLVKGKNIKTVTSAWIWSLLCRLDDVGNMNNDQVFPLRELGKRVVFLQLQFCDPETAAQLEALEQQEQDTPAMLHPDTDADSGALEGAEVDVHDGVDRSSDPLNAQPTKSHHAVATENTLATLDMILVVVGEIFGQRDLLEFRQPWTSCVGDPEA